MEQINLATGAREAAIQESEGHRQAAVNLKVAEQFVSAFSQLAKETNTVIMPANVADIGGLIASAMSVVKQQNPR